MAGVKVNVRVAFGKWLVLGCCQVDFLEMDTIMVKVRVTFKEWGCWWDLKAGLTHECKTLPFILLYSVLKVKISKRFCLFVCLLLYVPVNSYDHVE